MKTDFEKLIKKIENTKFTLSESRTLAEKFEDYVDVLTAKEDIKNGDVLTIDEVFPKKDNQQELVDFIKHEYELNNAFILMPTNAILVNFNKNIFSNFKEEA